MVISADTSLNVSKTIQYTCQYIEKVVKNFLTSSFTIVASRLPAESMNSSGSAVAICTTN